MFTAIFKRLSSIILLFLTFNLNVFAQVGIGTNSPNASSMLDVTSTSKGILVPRMNSTQRTSIASPANGLLVFDTETDSFWFFSTSWIQLISGIPNKIEDANNDTRVEVEQNANEDIIRLTTNASERITIDESGITKIGDSINHTYIEADGSLSYEGTATRFEDLRVPMSSTRKGAAEDPLYSVFRNDGSGSVGVYGSWFRTNQTEDLFFEVQMPHGWKEGSTLYPHIHWSPKTNTGGNKVRWGFEFIWVNVGGTFGNTTVTYAEDTIGLTPNPTANQHVISEFPSIDGAGQTLSSMLVCRVFRDGTHGNDSYNNSALMLQFDFHYEIDADGSRLEYTK